MNLKKPVVWTVFVVLAGTTVAATVVVWNWLSYGHLEASHTNYGLTVVEDVPLNRTMPQAPPPYTPDIPLPETPFRAKRSTRAAKTPSRHKTREVTTAPTEARPKPRHTKPAVSADFLCFRSRLIAGPWCTEIVRKGTAGHQHRTCDQCKPK